MIRRLLAAILPLMLLGLCGAQTKSRHFVFDYSFSVRNVDPGKPLRVWFPIPQSDKYQTIKLTAVQGDLALRETREPEYGNRMFYASTPSADKSEYRFSVKYDVIRLEHQASVAGKKNQSRKGMQRFLEPDHLVPVTGLPAELAASQVKPEMSEMEKARALYDYTFKNMRYDKSGSGWGKGDTLWACDAKRGNCTDFHSLFISMARSQKIPAKFEIGFPLPENQAASDLAGYHCWAEFYTGEHGWIPVDISEAWKHQEKKEYFFGAVDVHRIQFTVGRDIELNPRQQGSRLNYFIYPYVEVDGAPFPNVANALSFSEVGLKQSAKR